MEANNYDFMLYGIYLQYLISNIVLNNNEKQVTMRST